VIEAKDEQIAVLTAALEAALERERRLDLRRAEVGRRLSMDSADSGTPSSKERIGAKEARRARQQSERERRKDRFSALTLAGTRPVAPDPVDDDLPDHDAATMDRLFSRSLPDWSGRDAVAEFATGGAEILGDDPAAARARAGRTWDRTPGTESVVQMTNQLGMVFAKLDCKPRRRERLSELAIPALVVHGRRDPVLSCRQRRSARARDPRCAAARARTGRDGDPPHGRR
jgi:pimeloyl-ACP methyl ester carboxylesterase